MFLNNKELRRGLDDEAIPICIYCNKLSLVEVLYKSCTYLNGLLI